MEAGIEELVEVLTHQGEQMSKVLRILVVLKSYLWVVGAICQINYVMLSYRLYETLASPKTRFVKFQEYLTL